MDVRTRRATTNDAAFLAWTMLAASRSHLPRAMWDVTLDRPEAECLAFLTELARTETRSWSHHSRFLVAEVDGRPAAALCGYDPVEDGTSSFMESVGEAAAVVGWSAGEVGAMWERSGPIVLCRSDDAEGAWIIENVAALPAYRRCGLVNRLLREVLDEGQFRGHRIAQSTMLIGNTPAQRAYEKVGFVVDAEKRHPEFEAVIGAPGMMRLLRPL
jgi:ribosomal protein S18 acetylase RimI-like enzyme